MPRPKRKARPPGDSSLRSASEGFSAHTAGQGTASSLDAAAKGTQSGSAVRSKSTTALPPIPSKDRAVQEVRLLQMALERVLARPRICMHELACLLVHAQGKEYNGLLNALPAEEFKLRRSVATTVCKARAAYTAHVDEYYDINERIMLSVYQRTPAETQAAVSDWRFHPEPLIQDAKRRAKTLDYELKTRQAEVMEALATRREEAIRLAVEHWDFPPEPKFVEIRALLRNYDKAIKEVYASWERVKEDPHRVDRALTKLDTIPVHPALFRKDFLIEAVRVAKGEVAKKDGLEASSKASSKDGSKPRASPDGSPQQSGSESENSDTEQTDSEGS